MRFRHTALLLGGLVLMGLVAACGGSPAATPTPTPTPQAQAPTPTPTAQAPSQTPSGQATYAPQGFGQSFNQIVQLAGQETAKYGPVQWCSATEGNQQTLEDNIFQQLFPNVKFQDRSEQCYSSDVAQKTLLELQAGKVSLDYFQLPLGTYQDFVNAKVLAGPFNYKALGFPSDWGIQDRSTTYPASGYGIALPFAADFPTVFYNSNLVPAADDPQSLAGCLNPALSGKFAVNTTTTTAMDYLGLPQLWGEQELLDFAQKEAANKPIFVQSVGDTDTKIMAGQLAMSCGDSYYGSIFHIPVAQLGSTLRVIVPSDLGNTVAGQSSFPGVIAKGTNKPNAALLLAAFLSSDVAAKAAMNDPMLKWKVPSSIPGSAMSQLIQQHGFKVIDATDQQNTLVAIKNKLEAAWGLPTSGG